MCSSDLNDLTDYTHFRAAVAGKESVAVIGGGLIGCEFANDLTSGGYKVSVIDIATQPLPRLLPPEGSAARDDLEELFRSQRMHVRRSGIECASIFAKTVLMRELLALSVCPQEIARHLREEKLLAILPLRMPPVFGANSVMTLRTQEPTPALKAFVNCMREATSAA